MLRNDRQSAWLFNKADGANSMRGPDRIVEVELKRRRRIGDGDPIGSAPNVFEPPPYEIRR